MHLEAGTASALLIGATSLIGWLVLQTQSHSRAQRMELRARRRHALLAERYIFRLEHDLAKMGKTLPDKPDGYDDDDGENY
jgi:hypothetical protein